MTNFEESFKIQSLKDIPDKADETLQLIEQCFGYDQQHSFAEDFKLLINNKNYHNCYILLSKKDSRVIGHIGVCPRTIQTTNGFFPVTLLGGICLDEEFRGKKIFKKFFEIILSKIENNSTFIILWSGDPDLYLKNNFHLCLDQYSYPLENFSSGNNFNHQQILTPKDKRQIRNCFTKYIKSRFCAPIRTENDWEIIFNISSKETWTLRDKNSDDIIAYFFYNKGQDLNGIIHEVAIEKPEEFSSPFKEGFLWYPKEIGNIGHENHFGAIMRIGSQELLNNFLKQNLNGLLVVTRIDQAGNQIDFLFNGNKYNYPINDFLCGLWGPGRFEEIQDSLNPLYIPGVDSI